MESGTINGVLCNEKYKGDFHLQKYYTPENKRNHTRKNNGEVQSYYISENHSGADRFTRRKSNGFAAPTLKRESRRVKG